MDAVYSFIEDDDNDELRGDCSSSAITTDFVIKQSTAGGILPSACQTLLIVTDGGPGLVAEQIIRLSSNIGSIDVSEKTIASLYLTDDNATILVDFNSNQLEVDECCYNAIAADIIDWCKPDVSCVLSSDTNSKIRTLLTSSVSWSSADARRAELYTSLVSVRDGNALGGCNGLPASIITACEARGIAGISCVAERSEIKTADEARAYETLWPLLSKMLSVQLTTPKKDDKQKYGGSHDQLTTRTGNLYT